MYVTDDGVSWDAKVEMRGCVDLNKKYWKNPPQNGCDEKVHDLTAWGEVLNSTLEKSEGNTCGCSYYACNRDDDGSGAISSLNICLKFSVLAVLSAFISV